MTKKNNKVYDIEVYSDKERVLTNNNYYLSSKNKNIEDIYDTKGNKISSYNYNAYGIIDTKVSGYSYTGEHKDNTGLIYLRARYYKEEYKQFITKDTYKGEITNPLSQNQYAYANNNPIKYIDPSGHIGFWDVLDIFGLAQSTADLFTKPSWGNAGWLIMDTVGILPLVPSASTIKNSAKAVNAITDTKKTIKNIDNTADIIQSGNKALDIFNKATDIPTKKPCPLVTN